MSLEAMFPSPRLVELGKIKIGRKEEKVRQAASGPWQAPEKIDHFLITTLRRDDRNNFIPDHELMEELKADYADRDGNLRQLPIYVLSNDIEDVMQSAWLWYMGRTKLAAKSDGETLTKFFDLRAGTKLADPVAVPWDSSYENLVDLKKAPLFKKHTVFNCVIASRNGRWGGVYKFRTISKVTGDQLYGSLTHVKQLTGGVLRGLPLRLVIRPMQVAPGGIVTTIFVCHVELRGSDLHELQQRALQQAQFETQHVVAIRKSDQIYKAMLKAPGDDETPDEIDDVTTEFAPGNAEGGGAPAEAPVTAEPDPLFGTTNEDGSVKEG